MTESVTTHVVTTMRAAHRFADALEDPALQFEATSYADLWESWSLLQEPSWLPRHVDELAARNVVDTPDKR
jgi:hypothetical protein